MVPLFYHPASYIFSGPSDIGKTTLCFNLVRNAHRLVHGGGFDIVFILFNSMQPAYTLIQRDLAPNIPVHLFEKELPDSLERILQYSGVVVASSSAFRDHSEQGRMGEVGRKTSLEKRRTRPLLIIDDFLCGMNNDLIKLLFSRYCHHLNLSVMLITQSLFDSKDNTLRFCHRNTKYLFVFQSPRDMTSVRTLVSQMVSERKKFKSVMSALERELVKPRGYICFNFHPNSPSVLRFMTDILSDRPIVLAFPESI
jgi:hypothetical protein